MLGVCVCHSWFGGAGGRIERMGSRLAFCLGRSLIHVFEVGEQRAGYVRVAFNTCGRGENFEGLRLI